MPTKVLLVDDHAIIREGLKALLEKQPDIVVVGSVEDGRQAVATVHKLAPDLVIMDISMPNLNGIDATRKITEENRSVKIIALSIHSSRRLVSEMLKAGASGYILKYCLFDELIDAINTVLKGNIYLSPKITGIAIDN
jgi:DNA-binding NarL/FixJ family response regulator